VNDGQQVETAPTYFHAEDSHQRYLAKNPVGYCGLGGTGVACAATGVAL
jgi:peptide-methionine (S)-S-oxide reductase